jgi:putative phosphoesterase
MTDSGWVGHAPLAVGGDGRQIFRSATIISDIHGFVPALEAVLAEEASDPSDVLIVAGDTAAGPQPNEVIDILRRHQHRLVAISGNGDREVLEARDGKATTLPPGDLWVWAASEVTPENAEWLRALPGTAELELASIGKVHVCHATPQNDMDIVLVDTRMERWQEVFADLAGDVRMVVLGHTHMPFQRMVDGRRVVNPGSVGMSYAGPGAHWTRIREDGAIETRVTHFDANAALDAIAASSSFPGVREWSREYVLAEHTDVEVLAWLGSRDGRATP